MRTDYRTAAWMLGLVLALGAGCEHNKLTVAAVDPYRAKTRAENVLLAAAQDPDAVTRTNAMEALAVTFDQAAGDVMLEALDDESPMVRFAAAMGLGDVQYEPAREAFRTRLADPEADPIFQCAAIYGLDRLGDTEYHWRLGHFILDPDKWLRANAALVMGKIGHRSAIPRLKEILSDEKDETVQINIIESLASLGDVQAAKRLEGYVRLPFVDQQLVAIRALARLGPEGSESVLLEKLWDSESPRVKAAAAGGLARMGSFEDDGYDLCIDALHKPEKILEEAFPQSVIPAHHAASLQQIAAISLGWYNRPEAVDHLYTLLAEENGSVRVASAMSILLLLEDYEPSAPAAVGEID